MKLRSTGNRLSIVKTARSRGAWRIIYYLRDVYQVEHRIPNIYETCESCNLDLDTFERLFPTGYHRGALKIAGLRFLK
jgi:tRNA 2-thiouridine synthesizing protein E